MSPTRMLRAWRELPQERRLAAMACFGLFLTLFLPWYQETVFANGVTSLRSASSSLTGWGAFSFVEAAVLLVAAAVLILLFVRSEGQAFHVPGGDGGVITAAGLWTILLIVWRIFDKQGTSRHDQIAYTSGIEWGIFVALGVAAVLTYAGSQIRLAHEPEPPLPGEPSPTRAGGRTRRRSWRGQRSGDARRHAATRRAYPGPDMGAEDDWTQEVRARPRSIADDDSADPAGAVSARRGRPLDRREIKELDIAEPPTARLGRSAPPEPPTARLGRSAPPEPPTARLGRSAPAAPRRPAGPAQTDPQRPEPDPSEVETRRQRGPTPPLDPGDDQLTIRMDRRD